MSEPDEVGRTTDAAGWIKAHPRSMGRLVDVHGLPAHVLTVGPNGRRSLRFIKSEVMQWLEGRRTRQIVATIEGQRYRRAPL